MRICRHWTGQKAAFLAGALLASWAPVLAAGDDRERVRMMGNCKNCVISGSDFSGRKLTGVDFTKSELFGVSFADANLSISVFSGSTIADVSFANADLTGANFVGSRLKNVSFTGANLTGAVFEGAILDDTSIEGAIRCNTQLPDDRMDNAGCN